ncbi:MAG TPA: alpha/beta fold hydrolase [Gemmatimonadales bacterium]|nr:alpha/beta fold hydrolase [Gemmatimonadales bacterium]
MHIKHPLGALIRTVATATAIALTFLPFATMTANAQAASAQAAGTEGAYANVNGINLYYQVHGTGKPLVLLHGGLGVIEMFGPSISGLAEGRQVIAVDLQGHGRTADIDRPLSLEFMADDIAALLEHLDIGRADIMGYSMGGGVALQVAVRHPQLVDRLVLVSAPARSNAFYPELIAQQAMVNAEAAEMMKGTPMYTSYMSLAPRPEDFPRLLDKIGSVMKKPYDYSEQLASVKAPTLLVAADADMFPPSHAVEMFELLGGGRRDGGWDGSGMTPHRLAILPGLTHYNIAESPALLEVAVRFLDGGA